MVFIVISRCEAIFLGEKGKKEALFHFKGACDGLAITAIQAKLGVGDYIVKGQEYLFSLIFDRIEEGILHGVVKDGLQLLEF